MPLAIEITLQAYRNPPVAVEIEPSVAGFSGILSPVQGRQLLSQGVSLGYKNKKILSPERSEWAADCLGVLS